MNTFDILIMYEHEWAMNGKDSAENWLLKEYEMNDWSDYFIVSIRECFDKNGKFIRFGGDPNFCSQLFVRTVR
jgi:hypothetical protein